MFDNLSSKLQNAFRNLRGLGKISEANVADALREVRLALLDADVNFKVVRDFIERHAPLPGVVALADAPFWTAAQSRLLRETWAADADWAPLVDRLDAALRRVPGTA